MSSSGATPSIVSRRVRFEFPAGLETSWTPRQPELACMANAVSLSMPFVEPYVVASTRAALPQLDVLTRDAALAYIAQESRHHVQHGRFNDLLRARHPRVAMVEGWMARTYGWLERTRSASFNAAFAAGFETIAYSAARWLEPQLDEMFRGAAPVATTLFLWHLAEEVEHKGVAYDVHRSLGGSRHTYVLAMLCALMMLGWFTTISALIILAGEHRLWRPIAWFRITRWLLSFLFHAGPVMMMSASRSFHPSNLVDPARLTEWLAGYDEATGTLPVFEAFGSGPRIAAADHLAA